MTQTQHKPPMIELAPNQIYIKRPDCVNPVQTLVEGAPPDWSFHCWEHIGVIGLYYKGRSVTYLVQCSESGKFKEEGVEDPAAFVFPSLADAVQYCIRSKFLDYIDDLNKREGLEDWCIRSSFTPTLLNLRLSLPPQERKRLERVAKGRRLSFEQIALQALYTLLPELEKLLEALGALEEPIQ